MLSLSHTHTHTHTHSHTRSWHKLHLVPYKKHITIKVVLVPTACCYVVCDIRFYTQTRAYILGVPNLSSLGLKVIFRHLALQIMADSTYTTYIYIIHFYIILHSVVIKGYTRTIDILECRLLSLLCPAIRHSIMIYTGTSLFVWRYSNIRVFHFMSLPPPASCLV